jgi:tRNA A-37 threonylcarbamoyl transferase component Bud32
LNGTYIVESVLGEGGVGRVYRARHARIPTKNYALKVLHAEHSRDPQQLARFQREAEAAASLSHPNVVGVFDVGRTDDGLSYLACELLTGTDLDAYLERHGRIGVPMALHIAIQICEALEAAHQQNIIHRDLKPQNVFLLNDPSGKIPPQGHIKLVDFGLSRMLDHADTQLTKTGTLMGTPAFMAPEQATGDRGDHRVDIYGVGVILYAALTGRPPFLEETLPGMLVAVMTQEADRPSKLVPEIPQALELVIQRAMAKQPDDRYRNVSALRDALLEVQENLVPEHRVGRARMSSALYAQSQKSHRAHPDHGGVGGHDRNASGAVLQALQAQRVVQQRQGDGCAHGAPRSAHGGRDGLWRRIDRAAFWRRVLVSPISDGPLGAGARPGLGRFYLGLAAARGVRRGVLLVARPRFSSGAERRQTQLVLHLAADVGDRDGAGRALGGCLVSARGLG